MSCAREQKIYRALVGVYCGGIRTWNGRYSDTDMNVVYKINCVGTVPLLSMEREGFWFIPHDIPTYI